MKIVLDTNVWIAALISRGHCAELISHCARNHDLYCSEYILHELSRVLAKKFGYTKSESAESVDLVRSTTTVLKPIRILKPFPPDPNDTEILGTLLASQADCLVTGDAALLSLKRYKGIPIISPADFWRFERK